MEVMGGKIYIYNKTPLLERLSLEWHAGDRAQGALKAAVRGVASIPMAAPFLAETGEAVASVTPCCQAILLPSSPPGEQRKKQRESPE